MNRNNLFPITCSIILLIYSCGGPSETSSSSNPTPTQQAEPEVTPVDINQKNDTKGIGKFTSVTLQEVNPAEAKKGKIAFESVCASCHKVSDERLIGPPLKGVTTRRTPEWILNMIINPEENIKKDPLGKALLEEYKSVMPYLGTTEEQAKQILEYLRQNDKK